MLNGSYLKNLKTLQFVWNYVKEIFLLKTSNKIWISIWENPRESWCHFTFLGKRRYSSCWGRWNSWAQSVCNRKSNSRCLLEKRKIRWYWYTPRKIYHSWWFVSHGTIHSFINIFIKINSSPDEYNVAMLFCYNRLLEWKRVMKAYILY